MSLHDAVVIGIAKVCHEVNRAYCAAIGDQSQKSWEEAADWQRESAIKGVEFKLKNPMATPAMQHHAWVLEKTKQGWTYGPEKDESKKEHPCIMDYEQLPQEQRVKDCLFQAVVEAMK